MGPTAFLPGTHRDGDAHAALMDPAQKAELLASAPLRHGAPMPAGACALYDSRLLHCGGANTSPAAAEARVILYAGFCRSRSLMQELRGDLYEELQQGAHTLTELQRGHGAGSALEEERLDGCSSPEEVEDWQAVWAALKGGRPPTEES